MILQKTIPYDVTQHRPLPGIAPFEPADWLQIDTCYEAQIAERSRLLAERGPQVLQCDAAALPAAQELLQVVLQHLQTDHPGFSVQSDKVSTPDGREVDVRVDDPFGTLAHLVQEDFCLLQKRDAEHVLTGALLCFPASWTLSEKIGLPLLAIHGPVAEYDANIARRVQRLFDGIKVGRPLWRFNAMRYQSADLYHPRLERDPRSQDHAEDAPFLRSERQCLLRLPDTGAVVFSIHTYVVRRGQG